MSDNRPSASSLVSFCLDVSGSMLFWGKEGVRRIDILNGIVKNFLENMFYDKNIRYALGVSFTVFTDEVIYQTGFNTWENFEKGEFVDVSRNETVYPDSMVEKKETSIVSKEKKELKFFYPIFKVIERRFDKGTVISAGVKNGIQKLRYGVKCASSLGGFYPSHLILISDGNANSQTPVADPGGEIAAAELRRCSKLTFRDADAIIPLIVGVGDVEGRNAINVNVLKNYAPAWDGGFFHIYDQTATRLYRYLINGICMSVRGSVTMEQFVLQQKMRDCEETIKEKQKELVEQGIRSPQLREHDGTAPDPANTSGRPAATITQPAYKAPVPVATARVPATTTQAPATTTQAPATTTPESAHTVPEPHRTPTEPVGMSPETATTQQENAEMVQQRVDEPEAHRYQGDQVIFAYDNDDDDFDDDFDKEECEDSNTARFFDFY